MTLNGRNVGLAGLDREQLPAISDAIGGSSPLSS
jgi:hypothetical protein